MKLFAHFQRTKRQEILPCESYIERLGIMKHFAQDSFEDDLPDEDVDEVFSRLDQLKPPADFVNRVMQAISRLPLPQMLQPGAELDWDDEDLIVHHEHKRPS